MRAAVFRDPGHIEVHDDVPRPRPSANEVIVKIEACGICGSDLHLYRTNAHRGPSLLRLAEGGREIPGHEYAGTIAEVGSGVDGFSVGDRVVGVTGGGGMAEYVPVPVSPYQLVRMPDGVAFEEAATTEPLADGLQMIRLAAIQPDENVVVFGVGIIGLGVIQALRALGQPVGRIVAIDISEARLAMARELGATRTINPRTEDPLAAAAEACGTVKHWLEADSPDVAVVFDCAGYLKHMSGPPPLQTALYMLRPQGGRIILFGAYEDRLPPLDFMPVVNKQITIRGSNGYAPEDLEQALALMESGRVDRRRLISHEFALQDVAEAFETQGGPGAIKVLIRPSAG